MIKFVSILITILILLLAITLHELGHFLAGRLFKAKILEFAIGFGPKLFSKRNKKFTTLSFRMIPLGGYVKFGYKKLLQYQKEFIQDKLDKNKIEAADKLQNEYWYIHFDDIKGITFENLKPYQRVLIYLAGPLFNLISTIFLMILIEQLMYANVDYFTNLSSKSPLFSRADSAGMQLLYSIKDTFRSSIFILETIGRGVGDMVQGHHPKISSIIGVSKVASQVQTDNLIFWALTISMFISASLFTFNLIPLPPLDGWRILNEGIVKINKKPIPEKIENIITIIGISILLLFSIALIIYDLV